MVDRETDMLAWEEHYRTHNLPWDAGGPDTDLVRLVQTKKIPVGHALDMGTGPGHDAVYLIQQGFQVVAMDISPSAVKMARENASRHGVFGFFQPGDIRKIPMEDGFVDFVNDRGCFHVLSEADRLLAVQEVHRVLGKRGLYLLKVFSDKQPPGPGPHRFSRQELEQTFQKPFKILELTEGQFNVPSEPKSYSVLMEKR